MMRYLLSLAACFWAYGMPAVSQTDPARAEFIPGWRNADGGYVAGVLIDLEPGWKTYWRAPGDAGIPPRFDWAGSRNLKSVQPVWPTPKVMMDNGLTSIGYSTDVVIPLVIQTRRASQPASLRSGMKIGVCKDICIPIKLDFEGSLLPTDKRDPRLVAALVDRPLSAREAGVGAVKCQIGPTIGGLRLEAAIAMPSAGGREFVIVEAGDPGIWVSEAQVRRKAGKLLVTVDMARGSDQFLMLNRSEIRFTVLGKKHAVDIKGCRPG